ncbi:MAG TPA: hypothetical protein VHA52_06010, partial [Candidatus Babeliaceae bacterium]|nr:hypothetical protein [Candidatus Babeliaceae bacterium]
MNSKKWIKIVGAREHNLKDVTVSIPKDSLTVITGPSGSGKSSLALDVLYAEGQRRYIESLSAYARQFLGVPKKADFDRIEGLCPAIAIDQKTVGHNPRSTVGTITEISDYLRVLFARIGILYCPKCDQQIRPQTIESIAECLLRDFYGRSIKVLAPIVVQKKGEFVGELEKLYKQGYYRYYINGQFVILTQLEDSKSLALRKHSNHSIDIELDTIKVDTEELARIYEALQIAFNLAGSLCKVIVDSREYSFSVARMCLSCRISFPELEPRFFSFNSPIGACSDCQGLGISYIFDPSNWWSDNTQEYGSLCRSCNGERLHEKARAVKFHGFTLWQLGQLSLDQLLIFFKELQLEHDQQKIADRLVEEIINRLTFLVGVGVGYLSLNRTARTLSGGEGQRIRLATQIGSSLSGVIYILDEPSIGLHQRDNDRLITTLKRLRDQGNTIVVVEHDTDTMKEADYLIDMGPSAGVHGGNVIAAGTPKEVITQEDSLTGSYLAGRLSIAVPEQRRIPQGYLLLKQASKNNLKNVTVKFPLGVLCGISGVSGSGKSTLVMDELVPSVSRALMNRQRLIEIKKIEGIENIENIVVIDQSPLGRTSRSTPATYLGIFNDIRNIFTNMPESIARGYKNGQFSFNVKEGRCSECNGEGSVTVSMQLLPDVTMTCSRCKGSRYAAP